MKKQDKRILHRALDGEVNKYETRLLRKQLESDGHARAEFEQLKKVVQDSEKIHVDVPAGFTRKVMKGVGNPGKPPPRA